MTSRAAPLITGRRLRMSAGRRTGTGRPGARPVFLTGRPRTSSRDIDGDSHGTRVTATEVDHPEITESQVIKDDYCLTVDGECYVSAIQVYPATGTHIITIRNVARKGEA